MEFTISHKVDSHHTNPNYQCFVIDLKNEPTFHLRIDWDKRRVVKCDLMPTDRFALEMVQELAFVSPTFRDQLISFAASLNFSTSDRVHKNAHNKPVTDLTDMLL